MKTKITAVLAVMACLSLTACMSDADIRTAMSKKCESWGYKPGKPDFNKCVYDQEIAFWSAAAGMANNNAAMMNAQRPHQTVCTGTGTLARCTTY
jgi:hypothetical protein